MLPWKIRIPQSEKGTPANIHRRQSERIRGLPDQFLHVALDGQGNRLRREQSAHLVPHRFQNPFGRVGHLARRLLFLLPDEIGRGVVEKRFEDRHQRVFVLPENAHRQLA